MSYTHVFTLFCKRCLQLLITVGSICLVNGPGAAQDVNIEIDEYLKAQHHTGKFSGAVLIAKDDQILFDQGYGMSDYTMKSPNTSDTRYCIGSVTKQFIAVAVLQLQEKGLIHVHDPVHSYLSDFPNGEKITMHHLLTHTSGIPNYTDLPDAASRELTPHQPAEIIQLFKDLTLDFEPGAKFNYSNSGYVLLGYIVEKVSGRPLGAYLDENIFSVAGMEQSGFGQGFHSSTEKALGYDYHNHEWTETKYMDLSYAYAAGGIYSTTRDIYHWDQALFGGKLITERSVAAMITPRNPSSLVGQDYYGYGTIIDTVFNDKVRTGHGGQINGYSCYYSRIIGEDLTIITLTNKWTKADWISGMNKDLAAIVLGESYDIPALRVFTQLEDPVVQKIVGEYAFSPDFSLVISKNADQLYAQASGQHKMKLFATSGNSLYIEEIDAEISLVKDEDGKIIGLQFYQNGQAHQAKKVK